MRLFATSDHQAVEVGGEDDGGRADRAWPLDWRTTTAKVTTAHAMANAS